MNMLERVQNIHGAGAALGIQFCTKSEYMVSLPGGSRQFGIAGQFLFCFVDGYQETVFAFDTDTGIMKPIAYDFSEFLRLVLSCGSGSQLARIAMHYQNEPGREPERLAMLQDILDLTPIENPADYMKTVDQVIDCSRLR